MKKLLFLFFLSIFFIGKFQLIPEIPAWNGSAALPKYLGFHEHIEKSKPLIFQCLHSQLK